MYTVLLHSSMCWVQCFRICVCLYVCVLRCVRFNVRMNACVCTVIYSSLRKLMTERKNREGKRKNVFRWMRTNCLIWSTTALGCLSQIVNTDANVPHTRGIVNIGWTFTRKREREREKENANFIWLKGFNLFFFRHVNGALITCVHERIVKAVAQELLKNAINCIVHLKPPQVY